MFIFLFRKSLRLVSYLGLTLFLYFGLFAPPVQAQYSPSSANGVEAPPVSPVKVKNSIPSGTSIQSVIALMGPPLERIEEEGRRLDRWIYSDRELEIIGGVVVADSRANLSAVHADPQVLGSRLHPSGSHDSIKDGEIRAGTNSPIGYSVPSLLQEIQKESEKDETSGKGPPGMGGFQQQRQFDPIPPS